MRALDHLCRVCGVGRLEERQFEGGAGVWCPNCEAEAVGGHKALCFCGHRFPSGEPSHLKCIKNPNRSPENPHAVVVVLDEEGLSRRKRGRASAAPRVRLFDGG